MTGNATKAIAARVPFDEYIRILTAATEAKLNVSDYVIMKLNAPDRVSDLESQLSAFKTEVLRLKQELDKTKKERDSELAKLNAYSKQLEDGKSAFSKFKSDAQAKLKEYENYAKDVESGKATNNKEIARLSKLVDTLSVTVETQKQQLIQFNKANTDLTAALAKAQSDSTDLKKEISRIKTRAKTMYETLAEQHNASGLLGSMKEKYWAVIEEFTNSLK